MDKSNAVDLSTVYEEDALDEFDRERAEAYAAEVASDGETVGEEAPEEAEDYGMKVDAGSVVDGLMMSEGSIDENGDLAWQPRKVLRPNYNPVDVLLTKLERWLLQQPEWAVILAAPRTVRRQAITLIAKRLTTIPNRYSGFGQKEA